ncbi:MAG: alpha/beta hydrolase [Acidimicrobiia bacterium]|nr:alpha/beta hydrolase [Acidimicrobiia bacterium]
MSISQSSFISAADGTEIVTYAWTDVTGDPRGVIQIAHGLAEHGERYDRFAQTLNRAGYLAYATDQRGHGATAGGELGDFGAAGFDGLIADLAQLGTRLAADHVGLPVFLLGHSMGSFAAQVLIVDHAAPYAGFVLSGSTALDVLAAGMAEAEGPVGLEAFNVGFEHRTGFEWLSRDEAEVDKYVADPWCGFESPPEVMPMLFGPAARLADPEVLATVNRDLPLLILSGSADPLAGGGQLIDLLAQRYRDAGITDVSVILYTDGRHEMLNETNRDEVMADIIAWFDNHLPTD